MVLNIPDRKKQAILFTLRNEDDRWDTHARLENLNDGGGDTFIGLCSVYDGKYLQEKYGLDIPKLALLYTADRPEALDIIVDTYGERYWNGRGFDKVNSDKIAIRLFDLAVNCGFGGLNNIMERAGLGDIFVAEIVNDLIKSQGEDTALTIIKNAALDRYRSLRQWPKFGNGWTNRLEKNEFNIK